MQNNKLIGIAAIIVALSLGYYYVVYLPQRDVQTSTQQVAALTQQNTAPNTSSTQVDTTQPSFGTLTKDYQQVLGDRKTQAAQIRATLFATNTISTQQNADINLQNKCADRAAQFFKEFKSAMAPAGRNTYSYTNHWNKNLSKCFVLAVSIMPADGKNGITTIASKGLLDAFEYKEYGSITSDLRSDGSVESVICETHNNEVKNVRCYSDAEFDTYTNSFMSE